MSADGRFYTLAEANALIPFLQEGFFRIVQMQRLLEKSIEALNQFGYKPEVDMDFASIQSPDMMDHLSDLKVLVRGLQDEVQKINRKNCIILSLSRGQVYIPSPFVRHEKRVCFCWSMGLQSIVAWQFKGLPFARHKGLETLPDWARSQNDVLDLLGVSTLSDQDMADAEVC
jgi:hypothetical protein